MAKAAITAVWSAFVLVPVVVLTHVEWNAAGTDAGWHFASLDRDSPLFAWTRNRLALFAALYLGGWVLLVAARRRDPQGAKLAGLAHARAVPAVLAVATAWLLSSLALLRPPAFALLTMLVAVGFFALWALARSGAALAGALGRAALLGATLLGVAWAGEALMRLPGMVERTGGSLERRAALREAAVDAHEPRHPLGWRTRPRDAIASGATPRVFVLGDSFSYGDFVPHIDDLWPFVFEDAASATGRPVEVINSGVAGSATPYQLRLLETVGWAFEPDAVVLQYTLNDAGPPPDREVGRLLPVFGASLSRRSALYGYLENLHRARGRDRLRDWWPRTFRAGSPGWEASREALLALGREAREQNVPALLLLFPMFDSDLSEAGYRNLTAHEAVAGAAREAGLDFIDLRPRLAAIDPDPRHWWARPFDAHPGVAAQRVAGEAVTEWWLGLPLEGGPRGAVAAPAEAGPGG